MDMDKSHYVVDHLEPDIFYRVCKQIMLEDPAAAVLIIRIKNRLYRIFAKNKGKIKDFNHNTALIQNPGSIESITKVNYPLSPKSHVLEKPFNKRNHSVIPGCASSNAEISNRQHGGVAKEDITHPSQSFDFSNDDYNEKSSIVNSFYMFAPSSMYIHFDILEYYIRQLKMAGFLKITVAEVFDHNLIIQPPSHQTLPASATPSFSLQLLSNSDDIRHRDKD